MSFPSRAPVSLKRVANEDIWSIRKELESSMYNNKQLLDEVEHDIMN